ncbi:MAG TPA: hypothetical protein VMM93_07030 [Vicinamibacterales bacterium]|nr:hypothetical protein [Vicinamibacterales bacterium]
MSAIDRKSSNPHPKAAWRSPELRELGNLRDFVRTGHAFGKSGAPADGASDPGGESMSMN